MLLATCSLPQCRCSMHVSMLLRLCHVLQTRSVPEDSESGDALRMVAEDITAQSFVVMSVDLITDVRLEVSHHKSAWTPQWKGPVRVPKELMTSDLLNNKRGLPFQLCAFTVCGEGYFAVCSHFWQCTLCEMLVQQCCCPIGRCLQLQRQSLGKRQRTWSMSVSIQASPA